MTLNVVFVCRQFGGKELREEEQTAERIKSQMTEKEWEKVFEMSQDKNLYHNLCTSLFPTIHGQSVSQGSSQHWAQGVSGLSSGLNCDAGLFRKRRGEARRPAHAVRRRSQDHHGGDLAEGGHQRVHRGRPQHGQEPVPQVRSRHTVIRLTLQLKYGRQPLDVHADGCS